MRDRPKATPPIAPEDRLLSVDDVSRFLAVPVGTLYQWRHRGVGPRGFRVGRHLRYSPSDIQDWLLDHCA